jgi:LEA14-like dessication related protein
VAVAAAVVAGVVLAALVALAVLGAPSVTGVENRFGPVNETTTVIESDLAVRNPNPFGATLGGLVVDYAVDMNDVRMAEGRKRGVSVSSGTDTVPFTTHTSNDRIPAWWVSHVRNDERTALRVRADVHSGLLGASFDAPTVTREVETDMLSGFNSTERRPVNASQPLLSDPVLYVEETRAWWGSVNDSATGMRTEFVVHNPKPYPVATSRLDYTVSMNDVAVGEGSTRREVVIPAGGTETIRAQTVVRTQRLDEWWVTHLERNQRTALVVDFVAVLEVQGIAVRVPLTAYEGSVETDVFGTKPDDAGGDDGAGREGRSTNTATASPTPTDGGVLDGDESAATGTATPTPTTTDDGGLLDVDSAADVAAASSGRSSNAGGRA